MYGPRIPAAGLPRLLRNSPSIKSSSLGTQLADLNVYLAFQDGCSELYSRLALLVISVKNICSEPTHFAGPLQI